MDIFIGNLIGFALIVFLFWKFVRPPLSRAVGNQKDTIERHVAESEEAKARLADAQAAHDRALAEAKAEAAELHALALEDAKAIREDIKAQADAEVRRITEHGKSQVELTRANLVRRLRTDLGLTAIDGAGKLVRSHLSDEQNQSASIDRVIGELESMASSTPSSDVPHSAELIGLHHMRASSRDAARTVAREFDSAASDLDGSALTTAASELTEVITFLTKNPVLRKKLTEDEDNPAGKQQLVSTLFGGKVAPIVVDVVASAAKQRWSSSADFLTGLRRQNALIVLTAAEREGVIEQVEDELFRVSRLLEANPQLASLLSDFTHPADKRNALLEKLIGGQVNEHTWNLLSHTITLLHGQPAELAVDHLAELAAARRGESVAHVVSAAPLSDEQTQRLSSVLGNIYGRTISVQTEVRPEILGGLRIGVGDEIIDADIATRLAKATETLPR
ncbi:ATP synthase F1, delta subunit [Gordonia bronchialis DSM 43247]|uniref:Multifunctional fusion protein n=1 Tax=Gordonia bronchialis (strain ATCC 25592 / DSM 43247 / BCRC 13721 / JCM 3198 / KCTC 3076 / NBRC 16047 / NCTC 10667) TaxID=526226 RepID=D0L9I4_GORB4|nr:F0F1 ATP synthase subunit B/delta [Gordonia bronchialis]ACY21172.1 ATP synthase F1, delta subunit [Gordonia bronchialis DSM 43247]MCC3323955.1 F0F1 ATP synthase subunit B/delta [Gordonia bronchialis]QGS25137.1 F0F1 ATP synthase subunit B/delta [Gordonia bronchialis]STQ64043.1 ATP synthase subunit b-delta [Gordonia bronchialis]